MHAALRFIAKEKKKSPFLNSLDRYITKPRKQKSVKQIELIVRSMDEVAQRAKRLF